MNTAFLKSNRFWSLVLLVVTIGLGKLEVFDAATVSTLVTLFGGFIGIRTVDRFAEFVGKK